MLKSMPVVAMMLTLMAAAIFTNPIQAQTVDQRLDQILAAADLIEQAAHDGHAAAIRLNRTARSQNAKQIARYHDEVFAALETIEEQQDEIQFYIYNASQINPSIDPVPIASAAAQIEGHEDYLGIAANDMAAAASAGDEVAAGTALDAYVYETGQVLFLLESIRAQVAALR